MHYFIDPSHTMDGMGFGGNSDLSLTDKKYIGDWYPYPPSAQDSQGVLRTGDDCDEIDFVVSYNAPDVGDGEVEFVLTGGKYDMFWKMIEVPVGGADYRKLEVERLESVRISVPSSELDVARPIRFWKGKFLNIHIKLDFSWDVLTALPAKSRVSLTWRRDTCS